MPALQHRSNFIKQQQEGLAVEELEAEGSGSKDSCSLRGINSLISCETPCL